MKGVYSGDNTISFLCAILHANLERLTCINPCCDSMRSLLHLVDEVVSRDLELLLDNITHSHQVLEAFVKYVVYADAV